MALRIKEFNKSLFFILFKMMIRVRGLECLPQVSSSLCTLKKVQVKNFKVLNKHIMTWNKAFVSFCIQNAPCWVPVLYVSVFYILKPKTWHIKHLMLNNLIQTMISSAKKLYDITWEWVVWEMFILSIIAVVNAQIRLINIV